MPRRELKGDPSNPQTRRRASGDDPRVRPPREPRGYAEPGRPPSWTGLKIPCPVCRSGVWAHQINEAMGRPRPRGAPGRRWDDDGRQSTSPMIAKRWPKDPHTGAHGAYWEWEPASAAHTEQSEKWLAQTMLRWLTERGRLPTDQSYSDALDERDRAERTLESALRELVEVKDQLAMLQAEYARLRSETTRRAAANPRWTLTDDVRGSDYSHWRAAQGALLAREIYERDVQLARDSAERTTRYSREQYARALRVYAEGTDGSECMRPCCGQRDAMLAELHALSDERS